MKKTMVMAAFLALVVAGIILFPRAVVSAPEPEIIATSTIKESAVEWCRAHIDPDAIALCEPSAYND